MQLRGGRKLCCQQMTAKSSQSSVKGSKRRSENIAQISRNSEQATKEQGAICFNNHESCIHTSSSVSSDQLSIKAQKGTMSAKNLHLDKNDTEEKQNIQKAMEEEIDSKQSVDGRTYLTSLKSHSNKVIKEKQQEYSIKNIARNSFVQSKLSSNFIQLQITNRQYQISNSSIKQSKRPYTLIPKQKKVTPIFQVTKIIRKTHKRIKLISKLPRQCRSDNISVKSDGVIAEHNSYNFDNQFSKCLQFDQKSHQLDQPFKITFGNKNSNYQAGPGKKTCCVRILDNYKSRFGALASNKRATEGGQHDKKDQSDSVNSSTFKVPDFQYSNKSPRSTFNYSIHKITAISIKQQTLQSDTKYLSNLQSQNREYCAVKMSNQQDHQSSVHSENEGAPMRSFDKSRPESNPNANGVLRKDNLMFSQITFGENQIYEKISNQMEKNGTNIIKSKENFQNGRKLPESQEIVINEADIASSGDWGQNKRDSSAELSQDKDLEKSDIVPDSPVNNAKMTDVNGAFQTISSQIQSEYIYDSALNGSPKKQNSQSPTNRRKTPRLRQYIPMKKSQTNESPGKLGSMLSQSTYNRDAPNTQKGSVENEKGGRRTSMRTRFNGQKNVQVDETANKWGKRSDNKQELPHNRKSSRKSNSFADAEQPTNPEAKENQNLKKQASSSKNDGGPKVKKSGQNQFEDCLKIYKKMFMFDWDLKDIANSRHSPKDDLTSGAFWFYINTTYFPDNTQFRLLDNEFEDWVPSLQRNLNQFSFPCTFANQLQVQLSDSNDILKCEQNQIIYSNQYLQQSEQNNQVNSQNQINNNLYQIFNSQDELQEQDLQNEDSQLSSNSQNQPSLPQQEMICSHVSSLLGKRKKANKFKMHFTSLKNRADKHKFNEEEIIQIHDDAKTIPRAPTVSPFVSEIEELDGGENAALGGQNGEPPAEVPPQNKDAVDQEIAEIKKDIQSQDFEKVLKLAQRDLEFLQQKNQVTLEDLFNGVKEKYQAAIDLPKDSPEYIDKEVYIPEKMHEYGHKFISQINPMFAQDMVKNKEWYVNNTNKFLLNINYPSKLQFDFLKELELSQQRRNEARYRRIMDQMDKIDENKAKGLNEAKRDEMVKEIKELSLKQRAQIASEDACCAICGNGDYEDDDQIVFCVQCSMPVHQSCFGLEKVPEFDWICYNCITFSFQRGLMVKCMLCPKRGGAMKPTNIFSSHDKFYQQKIKNLSKKTGKNKADKINSLVQQHNISTTETNPEQYKDMPSHLIYKQQLSNRLENNCSLNELLQREVLYKEKIYNDYYTQLEDIQTAEKAGATLCLSEVSNTLKQQEMIELNFNKHERQNHCIPEDYSHFIRRNEQMLESKDVPVTDTLYMWVHHSCAMWMPGPTVTPKTPVRMIRLDYQKFNIGCVICGQKGIEVGAVIKCFKTDCQIYFHVECAKRAGYCMEIEKHQKNNNRERIYKIFCESHRPFKIIQEINEQNLKEVEDIQKFTRIIDRCIDIQQKHQFKPKKHISKTERNKMLRVAIQNKKQELIQKRREDKLLQKPKKEKKEKKPKVKKWKEKDKKTLLDRVKEKYLIIKKIRMNMLKIDPMIAERKRYNKEIKRMQKQHQKKKKLEFELKKKQFLKELQMDREMKSQERGLRNRIKPDAAEGMSGALAQALDDNLENRQPNQIIQGVDIFDIHREDRTKVEPQVDGEALSRISQEELEFSKDQQPNTHFINLDENMETLEENNEKMIDDKIEEEFQNEDSETKNMITLDLDNQNDNDLKDQEQQPIQIPELKYIPEYYKFANPINLLELEWTVTLSRFDFPWQEISFEPFSAKECYKMYTTLVTDINSFLKKVLGEKPKYQKMIQNQLRGLPTIDTMMNMQNTSNIIKPSKNPYISYDQIIDQNLFKTDFVKPLSSVALGQTGRSGTVVGPSHQRQSQTLLIESPTLRHQAQHGGHNLNQQMAHQMVTVGGGKDAPEVINISLYCVCKGSIQSEFMVACETGEELCPNGGWVHPQCSRELSNLTKEQIDSIDTFYCEDCKNQNEGIDVQGENESEEDHIQNHLLPLEKGPIDPQYEMNRYQKDQNEEMEDIITANQNFDQEMENQQVNQDAEVGPGLAHPSDDKQFEMAPERVYEQFDDKVDKNASTQKNCELSPIIDQKIKSTPTGTNQKQSPRPSLFIRSYEKSQEKFNTSKVKNQSSAQKSLIISINQLEEPNDQKKAQAKPAVLPNSQSQKQSLKTSEQQQQNSGNKQSQNQSNFAIQHHANALADKSRLDSKVSLNVTPIHNIANNPANSAGGAMVAQVCSQQQESTNNQNSSTNQKPPKPSREQQAMCSKETEDILNSLLSMMQSNKNHEPEPQPQSKDQPQPQQLQSQSQQPQTSQKHTPKPTVEKAHQGSLFQPNPNFMKQQNQKRELQQQQKQPKPAQESQQESGISQQLLELLQSNTQNSSKLSQLFQTANQKHHSAQSDQQQQELLQNAVLALFNQQPTQPNQQKTVNNLVLQPQQANSTQQHTLGLPQAPSNTAQNAAESEQEMLLSNSHATPQAKQQPQQQQSQHNHPVKAPTSSRPQQPQPAAQVKPQSAQAANGSTGLNPTSQSQFQPILPKPVSQRQIEHNKQQNQHQLAHHEPSPNATLQQEYSQPHQNLTSINSQHAQQQLNMQELLLQNLLLQTRQQQQQLQQQQQQQELIHQQNKRQRQQQEQLILQEKERQRQQQQLVDMIQKSLPQQSQQQSQQPTPQQNGPPSQQQVAMPQSQQQPDDDDGLLDLTDDQLQIILNQLQKN